MIMYIGIALAVLVVYAVMVYNGFISLKTRADESVADIDVQLKRRYDLIPNLVNTVKGYAAHESETLEKVIAARNSAMASMSGSTLGQKLEADAGITGTLKSIFALSENYPDLKANTNFIELQRELTDTEDKVQAARRFYNTNVRDLNEKIGMFPSSIIAKIFGFSPMEFFNLDATPTEREAVKVEF